MLAATHTRILQQSAVIPLATCPHHKTYYVWIESRRPGLAQTVHERHEVCKRCGKTIDIEPLLPRLARH
jgi:hypothetical protein